MVFSYLTPSYRLEFYYSPKSVNMLWLKMKASPASVSSRDRWASSSYNKSNLA